MADKKLTTSITVNDEEQAVALCLAIIRRSRGVYSAQRIVRTLAAFHQMTVVKDA